MSRIQKITKIIKKDNYFTTEENIYINEDNDLFELSYDNYRFDKESMEYMAKEAERVFETYFMEQELKYLEEKNYYALSEKYRTYTILELIKMLFMFL